jgi:hypothetical protein
VTAEDAAGTSAATTVTFSITNVDDIAPTITSGTTGPPLEENSGAGQTVYTITATDNIAVSGYAIAGTDAALLTLYQSEGTPVNGFIALNANPDYEDKHDYSFTVTATDAAGNTSAATTVTFFITNVDDIAPTITSGATGNNLEENIGAGQTVYTITADANDGGTNSYAIAGTDVALLSVNAASGVVTLDADPDYETKNSYSFTVTAIDAAGTSAATSVTFSITNVDDIAPTITSGTTGPPLEENSGAGQTVYTITADANDGGTNSYAIAGTDVALLSVNAASGVVTLDANPDFETKPNYSFTVTATDAAGTSAATTVTFSITNVDEVAPTITSGATGTNRAENSGAGQTVYTITATDNIAVSSYAIAGTDVALLTLTGNVVTLTANPDFETKPNYSFTVTAKDAVGNTSAATTVTFSITDVAIELGAFHQGGTIFYLDGTGGGLIVADANISGDFYWSNSTTGFGTSSAFGSGQLNTTRIVNNDSYSGWGGNNAAREANNYSIEVDGVTYSDWFLPSKNEAAVMFSSGVVTTFKTGSNWMWTSTGYPPWNAYEMGPSGYITHSNRHQRGYMYIKPVREF